MSSSYLSSVVNFLIAINYPVLVVPKAGLGQWNNLLRSGMAKLQLT